MNDVEMLHIFSVTESGMPWYEQIEPHRFNEWYKSVTEGVDPERHPVFVTKCPDEYSQDNAYFVIKGKVVTPRPVTTVTSFSID